MIKINLAKRKQITLSQAASKESTPKGPSALSSIGTSLNSAIDSSGIVTILMRVVIPGVFSIAAYFVFEQYIADQRAIMAAELQQITAEKAKIQTELNRISGFETVKAELELNEKILASKIETIQKLIVNRDFAFKSLVNISNSLPREVWLSEFSETDQGFEIKGNATEVSLVGDLMSRLDQTPSFKEVTLKSTTHDPALNQASFELSARRE